MKEIRSILYFYRIKDWIKSLGFSLIGLTTTKLIFMNPFLLLLGIIQSYLLFSFLFSFNDFGDYIVKKEKNFIGRLIKKSVLPKNTVLLLCFLPLVLSTVVLILNFSSYYFIFYLLFVILSIAYSMPKIRLRDVLIVDIICNVLFFSLIFLQSYFFVNTIINTKLFFFLFWIASYIFSHELIHQISHFEKDKKSGRISTAIWLGKNNTIHLLKFSFLLPIIFGVLIYFLFSNLKIFAVFMIFFSSVRFLNVNKFNGKKDFKKLRNKLNGTLEGGIYLVLNLLEH
jgi:4-hydroxybenzoate polyprenyltransferase